MGEPQEGPSAQPDILFNEGKLTITLPGDIVVTIPIPDVQMQVVQAALARPDAKFELTNSILANLGLPTYARVTQVSGEMLQIPEISQPEWAVITHQNLQNDVEGLYKLMNLSPNERVLMQMLGGLINLKALYENQEYKSPLKEGIWQYADQVVMVDIAKVIGHFESHLDKQTVERFYADHAQAKLDIQAKKGLYPTEILLNRPGFAQGYFVRLVESMIMTPERRQLVHDAFYGVTNFAFTAQQYQNAGQKAVEVGAVNFLRTAKETVPFITFNDMKGKNDGSLHFFCNTISSTLSNHFIGPQMSEQDSLLNAIGKSMLDKGTEPGQLPGGKSVNSTPLPTFLLLRTLFNQRITNRSK